jgi:hypothetical protein
MNSFDDLNQINSIKLENTGKFIEYFEDEPSIKLEMIAESDSIP